MILLNLRLFRVPLNKCQRYFDNGQYIKNTKRINTFNYAVCVKCFVDNALIFEWYPNMMDYQQAINLKRKLKMVQLNDMFNDEILTWICIYANCV